MKQHVYEEDAGRDPSSAVAFDHACSELLEDKHTAKFIEGHGHAPVINGTVSVRENKLPTDEHHRQTNIIGDGLWHRDSTSTIDFWAVYFSHLLQICDGCGYIHGDFGKQYYSGCKPHHIRMPLRRDAGECAGRQSQRLQRSDGDRHHRSGRKFARTSNAHVHDDPDTSAGGAADNSDSAEDEWGFPTQCLITPGSSLLNSLFFLINASLLARSKGCCARAS